MAIGLETARHEWEDALRRVESERADPTRYGRLLAQIEVVRSRVHPGVAARSETASRDLTTVVAAAFQMYLRGALDYEP